MTETSRIDRLLDAIELIKANRRDEARGLLRDLIREDSDFEDAWLWMSLAVDTLDQAAVCLDNVLRINPRNYQAAGALYRIRVPEMAMKRRRSQLRLVRDMAIGVMWLIIAVTFVGVYVTYAPMMDDAFPATSAPRTTITATTFAE